MTIKRGDTVARRVAAGAPPGETGVVIEIIRGARSAIYRIRWASGQEEECRLGSFRANAIRVPRQRMQQVAHVALAAPPEQAAIAAEPPNEDIPPSDNESVGSSEGSESSADVPNDFEGLNQLLQLGGGVIAPPDVPAGGAIELNAPNARAQVAPAIHDINGVIWEAKNDLTVDVVTELRAPRLQWFRALGNPAANVAENQDIFDCFRLFFPEQFVQTILDLTNHNIALDTARVGGTLQRGELWKYFGLRLAMALEPVGGPTDNYWNKPVAAQESIRQPRNFGERFSMSRNRFRCIERNLQYGIRVAGDKWWRVRGLINAFNERMAQAFYPSEFVTVDELMSFWLGKDGAYYEEGLAHVTKMKSKPRGVGLMMKAMADGATNIICSLELQEGKHVLIITYYAQIHSNLTQFII